VRCDLGAREIFVAGAISDDVGEVESDFKLFIAVAAALAAPEK
jgi:hypothetical protein